LWLEKVFLISRRRFADIARLLIVFPHEASDKLLASPRKPFK
jgi:hypothetical protein